MYFTSSKLAALASLAATATEAHMILAKPPGWKVNNSPLNGPSGGYGISQSNYPCKLTAFPPMPRTKIPVGGSYEARFEGSATHGGGSCQFSLSKDLKPTKKTPFKVIHSVQGGCPARGVAGNIGDNPHALAKDSYKFTIPSNVAPGDYTLAWTWFNKIGNREMYMNCAPITVTGGGKVKRGDEYAAEESENQADVADDYYNFNSSISATGDLRRRAAGGLDSFPDLFLANIPDVKCTTKDSTDLKFPNPGKSVENNPGSTLAPPIGDTASCKAPLSGGSAASSGGSSSGGAGGGASSGASSGGAPAAAAAAGGASGAASPSAAASPPGASSGSSGAAPPSTPPPAGGSADGQCAAGAQPCQAPGSVVCMAGGNFGLCGTNNCAVPQKLAAGTTCKGGKIMRRSLME